MRRTAAVLVACAAALLMGAGEADAGPEEDTPMLVLQPSTVAPGQTFTATLTGYCFGNVETQVRFSIDAGNSTALAFCRPSEAVGTLTAPPRPDDFLVRAIGVEGDVASAPLTVASTLGGEDEEPLANTGPEPTVWMSAVAAGLLATGLGLFAVARHRRS